MKCEYWEFISVFANHLATDEEQAEIEKALSSGGCHNEAEWISCHSGEYVCTEHKCRCNRSIKRAEEEKAPTPSHWLAL